MSLEITHPMRLGGVRVIPDGTTRGDLMTITNGGLESVVKDQVT